MIFFYYCKYFNYLLFRTAIEVLHAVRQSRTYSQILFAVCLNKKQALTGGKSLACEDKSSKKIGAESTMLTLVYFYIIMIVHKCQQSAAQSCSRTFELRVLPFGKTWEEPASEEYGKWKAREAEKQGGKEARRNIHDKKEKGVPDRTKKELNEN